MAEWKYFATFASNFVIALKQLFIILTLLLGAATTRAAADKLHTVVIDPGHGGRDYGAVGKITNEKTINLDVALEVRRLLKDRKDIKVIMTRDDDRFIELKERAAIANRNHGDLFMSIHVNSVANSNKNRQTIRGASVYALGLHRSASNFEVAKRENSVMELESDYSTSYQGFDPSSTESYIMFELSQNKHLDQSISFADMAQRELTFTAGRADRGVLQAGFWVLHASAMPSVLVELDFICNPTMEQYLNSSTGKKQMARALANAIVKYFGGEKIQATEPEPIPAAETPPPPAKPETPEMASENTGKTANAENTACTWRVQFLASDRPLQDKDFKGVTPVDCYQHGGLYKYTTGDFATKAEAEKQMKQINKLFPQAFVVKFQNGQRAN